MVPLESDPASNVKDGAPDAPLYFTLLNENTYLRNELLSSTRLSHILNNLCRLRKASFPKILHEVNSSQQEEPPLDPSSETTSRPPLLFRDLDWVEFRPDIWPIRPGDYSPLSPDGELLDRTGKIGLDFWRWNRENAPLGYTPPLCTCKRTKDAQSMLRQYALGIMHPPEKQVCDNDVCRGLLYIPHSLLEVPLNRVISNGSQFVKNVAVPNETDVYCGNMKHTLIICTTSVEHETECLKAIRNSDAPDSLIYRVSSSGFIPFFKKHAASGSLAPLMTVEPIDSDVSDTEENYGFGEIFAVKFSSGGLIIHKYNTASQTVVPLEASMLRSWLGGNDTALKDLPQQAPVTSVKDYVLCELIESFSNERRPLSLFLDDTVSAMSHKGIKLSRPLSPPRRSHKHLQNEPLETISNEALESAHLMNIIDALSGV